MYSCNNEPLTIETPAIVDLSRLLNRLPIISDYKKNQTFRNTAGVRRQLLTFEWSLKKGKKAPHIGKMFDIVYNEYKDKLNELHQIAQAIHRCESLFTDMAFGADIETEGFPEGAILSHLHRNWEKEFGKKHLEKVPQCEICCIRPQHIYVGSEKISFLEVHLLIPPTEYSPDTTLKRDDFITVCPNCHRVLHQTRPWLSREHCTNILI